MPLGQVVRKGQTAAVYASGPTVGGLMHGPLGAGFSPMMGAQVGWAIELPRFSLMPRLSWSVGHAQKPAEDFTSHTFRELSLELAGLYVFDLGRLAVAPLVSVGWGFFKQTLEGWVELLAREALRAGDPAPGAHHHRGRLGLVAARARLRDRGLARAGELLPAQAERHGPPGRERRARGHADLPGRAGAGLPLLAPEASPHRGEGLLYRGARDAANGVLVIGRVADVGEDVEQPVRRVERGDVDLVGVFRLTPVRVVLSGRLTGVERSTRLG